VNKIIGELVWCVLNQHPDDCRSRFQQWFPLDECSSADGSTLPSAFRSESVLYFAQEADDLV